ncbi:MAG: ergothioneine biosynthesis protein EgtB [Gemmatimonadaceae bacterium]|nr:ergothioneine biosynthesis protein EgtB [Gemmatimonadaceae bacterium]NUO95625.1 ergothioneine biosynthesis protein EgtB [Gemmatimonadaceae bacterium]NUP56578.1 ergothioneine biosynthesis protein EgtB [Gemmatimonadaceae bacterium]NUR33589.1 ergothioneine biosynthesis protein EgtB [Gemmatimonadaceae bacterium]HWJ32390.1 ergothioneine biosynthesis protein EgtB [Gaiellaceae bacterium]
MTAAGFHTPDLGAEEARVDDVGIGGDSALGARYDAVRAQTEFLCEPLEVEDYVVSSMPDVSPTKWHLAHTSWFFETFVLAAHDPSYRSPDPRYAFLFNSYYVQAGERHCRAKRGLVTRPTVDEVFAYRAHVDDAMHRLIARIAGDSEHPAAPLIELGTHHEQQHQELLLTDIKHVLWMNPLRPVYLERRADDARVAPPSRWVDVDEGVCWIGHEGSGFAFDNEGPRHRVFLEPFRLASRLVTNGEYLEFIEDGGYRRSELWLSAGLATVQDRRWEAPLYWERADDGTWTEFTLGGTRVLSGAALAEPVSHLSYYEADAFARWAGARLPTEFEWEAAARGEPMAGPFVEAQRFHPTVARTDVGLAQLYGDAWQWTHSAYVAYPNFTPAAGAIGEYNGKWMADQWVLRGASCATPASHARPTYRNFFPSDARWQFSGIRLARRGRAEAAS